MKVVNSHNIKLSNLHRIGKYGKGKWGKIGKIIKKNRNFHIVSIDTESAPAFMYF